MLKIQTQAIWARWGFRNCKREMYSSSCLSPLLSHYSFFWYQDVCGAFPHPAVLWHQLSVLQHNSVLTVLSRDGWMLATGASALPAYRSQRVCHQPPSLDLVNLLECLTGLRKTAYKCLLQFITKRIWCIFGWKVSGGSIWKGACLLCVSEPPCHVFTNPSILQTACFWNFYRSFTRADMIINLVSSPSPLSGKWGRQGWKSSFLITSLVFLVTWPHPGILRVSSLEEKIPISLKL